MKITFDADDLRPIIELVVTETLSRVADTRVDDDRLAYPESEAAQLCGLETHVLREQRRLGRIEPCAARPGRRVLYTPASIRAFLANDATTNDSKD